MPDPIASAIERECCSLLSSLADGPGLHSSVGGRALRLTSVALVDQRFSTRTGNDGSRCAETSLVLKRCSQASTLK